MIKHLTLCIFFVLTVLSDAAQNTITTGDIKNLKQELAAAKDDSTRVLKMGEISYLYAIFNSDSCKAYGNRALKLAQEINFKRGEVRALFALADGLSIEGNFPVSMERLFKALQIASENYFLFESALCLNYLGAVYWNMNDYAKSHEYYLKAREKYSIAYKNEDTYIHLKGWIDINAASSYADINQLDSAMNNLQAILKDKNADPLYHPVALGMLGDVYFKMGQPVLAIKYLIQSLSIDESRNDQLSTADACWLLSKTYSQLKQVDSASYYSKKGLANAEQIGYKWGILVHSQLLADLYENEDLKLSHQYLKKAMAINNELYGPEKIQALQKTLAEEQERQRQTETKRTAYENRIKQYSFASGLAIMFFAVFFLYRNNRQKQRANVALGKTLTDLKSAQQQLIQSEKMASLGELTAGIAHEIQNPLNFVNNFSEVNKELADELEQEIDRGNYTDAKAIAKDIRDNEEKINHHGKRADAIVKGMLQHSRTSTGVKEPTDINALCDEYLRLSCHGLRAKDKSFNATIKTNFDETIGNINIIPQDIGRVLLNLYNNAFYAVDEKKKYQVNGYEPAVSVSTKKTGNKVEIKVADNGNGIPQKIIDKIFQPFFTTKPTGQGTGLGLSLSYDIIKAHGGEITVQTEESEGTVFRIFI